MQLLIHAEVKAVNVNNKGIGHLCITTSESSENLRLTDDWDEILKSIFLNYIFNLSVTKVLFPKALYASIGSGNGLVQAITRTNGGLVYWRIYASADPDELNNPKMVQMMMRLAIFI